jgi:hypothetical protein
MARDDPGAVAAKLSAVESHHGWDLDVSRLVANEKQTRRQLLDSRHIQPGHDDVPLMTAYLSDESDPATRLGWDGTPIEMWRLYSAEFYWHQLIVIPNRPARTYEDTTMADWALPWLDVATMARDRESWNRLFYYEASATAMPRNWLRVTTRNAQLGERIGTGNPADEQHASYLVDADLFLSGDERYVRMLRRIEGLAPARMASPRVVSARAVDLIAEIDAAVSSDG